MKTGEGAKRVQRLGADMVLYAFGVAAGYAFAYAERDQKSFDDAMAFAGLRGEALPERRQEHTAIGLLQHKPILGQALQHFRDRRLRNAKALRNVDLPSLAPRDKQIVDQLDIIFHQFQPPRLPVLTEAFRLDVRGNQSVRFVSLGIWHGGKRRHR